MYFLKYYLPNASCGRAKAARRSSSALGFAHTVTSMPIDKRLVRSVLDESLERFLETEINVLLRDVSERNNCGRLAIYMERIAHASGLTGYYADTEYNRKQNGEVKTILDDQFKIVTINCDLILHSRGNVVAEDNLIAVEMKKSDRPSKEKQKDRDRLRALTKASFDNVWSNDGVTQPEHVCGYILGAYIEINQAKRTCLVEYYAEGHQVEEVQRSF